MTTKNDITGDDIKSKPTNQAYLDGYDAVFGLPPVKPEGYHVIYVGPENLDNLNHVLCNLHNKKMDKEGVG